MLGSDDTRACAQCPAFAWKFSRMSSLRVLMLDSGSDVDGRSQRFDDASSERRGLQILHEAPAAWQSPLAVSGVHTRWYVYAELNALHLLDAELWQSFAYCCTLVHVSRMLKAYMAL